MSLLQYIQGARKGKAAHRLEREAMQDPFLADALDGYDKVQDYHSQRIKEMQQQISQRSRRNKNQYFYYWSMAAGILLLIGIGSYFALHQSITPSDSPVTALAEKMTQPIIEISQTDAKENASSQLLAQNDKAVQFTPPVIAKDEMVNNQSMELQDAKMLANADILPVDTSQTLLIAMKEDNKTLDEVVVMGYATQKKQEMTASVSKIIKEESPKKDSYKNFNDYVKKSLVHPTDDECKDAKGTVTLHFFVDENGRPYTITVKKSLCPSADAEAIRLVKEGPAWPLTEKELTQKIKF
ncbi:MAG: hypothetical protein LBN18_08645 [Dysgonamonadaceae bacterium]|jgi:hypothetical protein|nr:hypothetical protein [Dysgonamonadaceae bacterium]